MDTRKTDLNLLLALEALLAERNVTRAARRLRMSQPALSAQLARLRDMFGDPLFLPAQRGVIPTQRALELAERLTGVLDQVRSIVTENTAFDPDSADFTVSMAASDYVQQVLLIRLILDVRRQAPQLRIALKALDGRTIEQQMERGEVDIAFMTRHTAPESLHSRPLFDERYVCIAAARHPRIRGQLSLAAYLGEEHVVLSPRGGAFATDADTALAALGVQRTVAVSAASFLCVPEIVARSDLLALVPARLVSRSTWSIQRLAPPFSVRGFSMAMLWHDRTHGHPGHRWLRAQIHEGAPTSGRALS